MSNKQPPSDAKLQTPAVQRYSRPRATVALAERPTILNALPDVAGDDQKNVIPLSVQATGMKLTFPRWSPLADEFDTEPDVWTIYVGNAPVAIGSYTGGDPEPPDPFSVDLPPLAQLKTHGEKAITYQIVHASGNVAPSEITHVFVDAIDPNLNNQPPAITLPADLAGPITPAYLNGKLGLVCRIPRMADNREGDRWQAWFGDKDEVGIEGTYPATGPAEAIFSTAFILAAGEGDYIVRYRVVDRAENATQFSFPRSVTVEVNETPVPSGLVVVEAPLVDREEARTGVTVRLTDITNYLSTDIVQVFWQGTKVGERPVGLMPVFPFDFPVPYAPIALPGEVYTATVRCTVTRASAPLEVTVDVNLAVPGGGAGPGPVDDTLDPPTIRGNEGHENRLVEADRNFPATATFTIPPGLGVGDFIDIYYGTMGGTLASTYTVTGLEDPSFEVVLQIPWGIVDSYGNGNIPSYYVVRNAINFKHSPDQTVMVDIYSLSGLTDPRFSLLSTAGTLNCFNTLTPPLSPAPWEGVPIFIKDDVTLEEGDRVIVSAARYAISDPATPVGDPVESTEREIMFNDIQNGFTVMLNLASWFRDFAGTQGRGWVGVRWSVLRPSTNDRGVSNEVQVRWDFRGAYPPLGTCVPGSTRAGGTL